MNPNQPSREEIEERITALLLGELPADEARLLRYTISQDPALAKLHEELASTIVLVREAAKTPASAPGEKEAPLKLADERRAKLLAHFKTPRPRPANPLFWLKRIDLSRIQAPRLLTVLAVLAIVAVLAAMMLPALSKAKNRSVRALALNEARQKELEIRMRIEDENAAVATAAPASFAPATPTVAPAPILAPPPAPIFLPATTDAGESEQAFNDQRHSSGAFQNKPAGDILAPQEPAQPSANSALGTTSQAGASVVLADKPADFEGKLSDSFYRNNHGGGSGGGGGGNSGDTFAVSGGVASGDGWNKQSTAGKRADESLKKDTGEFGFAVTTEPVSPSAAPSIGVPPAGFASGANRSRTEDAPANLGEEYQQQASPATAAPPVEKLPDVALNEVAGESSVSFKSKIESSDQLAASVQQQFLMQATDSKSVITGSDSDKSGLATNRRGYFAVNGAVDRTPDRAELDVSASQVEAPKSVPKPGSAVRNDLPKDDVGGLRYLIDPATGLPINSKGEAKVVSEQEKLGAPVQDAPLARTPLAVPIPQPEILTRENNFSTFSFNVSDVSFKLAAASLEHGQMPDAASIRSEEFINAFDYRDPEAADGQPLTFASERARYPFAQNRDLLRFSVKTAAAGRAAGRPLNLVLLLDNSGSMERADRVAIIREALRVLATQLQPQDTVSVVTFARTARLWADGVHGNQAGETLNRVGGITPEGGTNLEEAMKLAYETAHRHYLANGMNRVVLLTDGAANLGDVNPADLKQKVEAQRQQGIALDCFGIGFEDYNDDLLEQLSSHGDGRYAFLNSSEDVSKEFAAKLAGALQVAASDVKVQVEFNPQRVIAYRQIGYAKHQLTKEQFRDNTVDAAEIAAQEAGNALYTIETRADGVGPIATVRVRYKVPGTTDYRERSWDVPYEGSAAALEQSSPAMRLAATAGAFSEWLAASPFAQEVTPDELLKLISGVPQVYGADQRPQKLEWMIRQAKSVSGK